MEDYCIPVQIGDGKCQSVCNDSPNRFDGGDCCLPSIIEDFCDKTGTEMVEIYDNGNPHFTWNYQISHRYVERNWDAWSCVCNEDGTQHPGLEGKNTSAVPSPSIAAVSIIFLFCDMSFKFFKNHYIISASVAQLACALGIVFFGVYVFMIVDIFMSFL